MQAKTEKLLGIKEVLEIVPVAKNTIYRMMHKGKFPAHHRVSEGRVCWRQSEIEKWIDTRWEEEGSNEH